MVLKFLFLSFCFFEMMMDQTIYELAFWTIFFPYPKPQKIIGSRFNCCGNIDTRLSMCFMLSMILVSKVIWTHQIYCHWMVCLVWKRLANFKNYYLLFSCIFFYWSLAFRLVLLNVCTLSYKVLRQVGKVFSSQKDFKICQCKSVLKFMYLSWVLIRRF